MVFPKARNTLALINKKATPIRKRPFCEPDKVVINSVLLEEHATGPFLTFLNKLAAVCDDSTDGRVRNIG